MLWAYKDTMKQTSIIKHDISNQHIFIPLSDLPIYFNTPVDFNHLEENHCPTKLLC